MNKNVFVKTAPERPSLNKMFFLYFSPSVFQCQDSNPRPWEMSGVFYHCATGEQLGEQQIFIIPLVIEGTSEKVLQFLFSQVTIKAFVLINKNALI
jgi:hypothetical protein